MGFIDFQTMIDIRDKLLQKMAKGDSDLQEQIDALDAQIKAMRSRLNVHTLCKINHLMLDVDSSLFDGEFLAKEGSSYSFALGTKNGYYFSRDNGTGLRASKNDYLHQRKYYGKRYYLLSQSGGPTLRDLLNYMFGDKEINYLVSEGKMTMSTSRSFPGYNPNTFTVVLEVQETLDKFLREASIQEGSFSDFKVKGEEPRSISPGEYYSYTSKLYVVEDVFDRKAEVPAFNGFFCKRVMCYAHIIVNMEITSTGFTMRISQLRY